MLFTGFWHRFQKGNAGRRSRVQQSLLSPVMQRLQVESLESRLVLAVSIDLVTVGEAGNAADTTNYGSVGYTYAIGRNLVTIEQYVEFLNAVARDDTHGVYDTNMATFLNISGISRSGSSGSYGYAALGPSGITAGQSASRRPITFVNWFDAARFANWMSNGQPTGGQDATTTEDGAYRLAGATSGVAPAKNTINPNTSIAPTYYLPTENEWYKSAYYDPSLNNDNGGYWDYATRSNSAPGNQIGEMPNQANWALNDIRAVTQSHHNDANQNYLTDAGAFSASVSAFGTYDQTGNVYQWNDLSGTASTTRGVRGGTWYESNPFNISASNRYEIPASLAHHSRGFRLASTLVNQPPSEVALSASSVTENSAAGTVIGSLSAVDPDDVDTFTYSLVSGDGDTDNASFAIVENTLRTVGSLNFETQKSYSVRIRVADQYGLSAEKSFAIAVIDIDEAPTVRDVFIAGGDGRFSHGILMVSVAFSGPVYVSTTGGMPTLTLETGTTDRSIPYSRGSGTNVLEFSYTILPPDTTDRLDYESVSSLSLNGGSIKNTDGTDAYLSLPMPGTTGSIGVNNAIAIDTTAPTVSIAASNTSLKIGETADIFFALSEPASSFNATHVTVIGGTLSGFTGSGTTYHAIFTPASGMESAASVSVPTAAFCDIAGNDSLASDILSIAIDTIAPSAPVIQQATDLDGVTAEEAMAGLVEVWHTTAGNTIKAVISGTGGTVSRSFQSTGTNDQVFALLASDIATIGDGWSNVTFFQVDAAGNSSSGNGANFLLDTIAPSAPVIQQATDLDGVTAEEAMAGLVEVWHTTAGNTIEAVISGTGGTVSRSFQSTGTNDQVFALLASDIATIGDGWSNVTFFQVDAAGNSSSGNGANFLLDTTLPTTPTHFLMSDTGTSGSDGISADGRIAVSGIEGGASWSYSTDAGASWTTGSGAQFTLQPGDYAAGVVRIMQTDAAGNSGPAGASDKTYSIRVNKPSELTLLPMRLPENQPVGITVGTLSVIDEDIDDAFTYSLVGGTGDTDNASFTIVGNSLVTAASFDFEAKDSLAIRVRATDQAGLSTDKVFVVRVTDLFIENGLVGEYRFDASTSDSSGAGNDLTLAGTTSYTTEGRRGGQSLVTRGDRSLYYSTGGHLRAPFLQNVDLQAVTFSFWVRNETTASPYGSNHAAEAYVFASRAGLTGDGTSVMIAPTGPTGLIGNQQVTWADWKMVTLVVESSAALSRYVTYVNGVVAARGDAATDVFPSADVVFGRHYWPTGSSARMDVEWDDMRIFDRALTAEEVRSLHRFDTGFPFFTSASSASIAEDHPLATPIYTAVARDPEQLGITYSLKPNEGDSSLVQVDPDTGAVTLPTGADYETRSSYAFTVVGTDADGLFTEQSVTVTVTDINEAPTDISLTGDTIRENAPVGTAVGMLSTSDEDADDTFTYSLVAGAGDTDNAAFMIDGDAIKTATTFNDDVQSTYRIRIRTTDQGGLWTERAFAFALLDTTPPTVGITSSVTKLRAGETATVSFSLSSGTANFIAADVALTGGTLSNFQRLSATSYSATFTPSAGFTGTGAVSVPAAVFTNAAGVANDAGATLQFAIDTALPAQLAIARLGAAVTVAGLEPEATWQYSLDGGTTWQAGSSAIFGIPAAEFAANQIQVRQTDKAGNPGPAAGLAGVKIAATPLSTKPFDPAVSRQDVRAQAQVDVGTGSSVGLYARYAVVNGKTNLYQAYVSKAGSGFNATIVRFAAGVGAVVKTVAAPSGKGLLEFSVVGSTLSLFLDGKLLTCVVDGSVAGPGLAGTFMTTGATLSQFLVSGLYEPTVRSTKSFDGTAAERDMRAQANVDLATGSAVGLYARYSVVGGKVNLYQAYLHKVGADFRATIVRFAAGVGATVTSVVAPAGKGLLQLDVVGSRLSLSLDGKLLTSVTDASVTGPGTAGTFVAAGTSANGFSVARLMTIGS